VWWLGQQGGIIIALKERGHCRAAERDPVPSPSQPKPRQARMRWSLRERGRGYACGVALRPPEGLIWALCFDAAARCHVPALLCAPCCPLCQSAHTLDYHPRQRVRLQRSSTRHSYTHILIHSHLQPSPRQASHPLPPLPPASPSPRRTMTARAREIKFVLLGDSGVGKSSLVLRFVTQSFKPYSESTIGASFMSKVVKLDGQTVKVGSRWEC